MKKCIVLFSGGLDSRLTARIMKNKGFDVVALYFKLPFSKDNEGEIKEFCEKEGITLQIIDCTKSPFLEEYLDVIKNPKFKRGTGFNPCIDCKIFLFKKTKEFAEKNKIECIASGEVLNQRPMSQTISSIKIIENESDLVNKILRPLMDLGIKGRKREEQIKMADEFKIDYPSPAGGCLLCEKQLTNRFRFLVEKGMINERTLPLISIGRHFVFDDFWIVLGRNKNENKIIENAASNLPSSNIIVPSFSGPSAIAIGISDKTKGINKKTENFMHELIESYSKRGGLEQRKKFSRFKL